MKRLISLSALFVASLLFLSCGTPYGLYYSVKKGDTLQSISARYHATPEVISQANALSADELLVAGISLFIPGVEEQPAVQSVEPTVAHSDDAEGVEVEQPQVIEKQEDIATIFTMPVQGNVVKKFAVQGSEGVDFACKRGEKVVASAAGKVLFASAHKSFGNTVIIQHSKSLITVYAFLSEFRTKEGATVKLGETIAICGQSGINTTDALHFEVRSHGKPVDPLSFQPE
ncbi:peptidoglycan DD-metalloendopeptidase family protein [bacterium]|nr:peptidoglycan DD-metalloendopeptidase family protein [bacterium]